MESGTGDWCILQIQLAGKHLLLLNKIWKSVYIPTSIFILFDSILQSHSSFKAEVNLKYKSIVFSSNKASLQHHPVSLVPTIDSDKMKQSGMTTTLMIFIVIAMAEIISGEDPYRFFTWNVTYGDIYPLGVKQQVCN